MIKNFFSILFFLALPCFLHAEYFYDETFLIPLPQTFLTKWKMDYQKADENGASSTRYIPENETSPNWTQLLNIQFRDKKRIKGNDAQEAMKFEASHSKWVTYKILSQQPNDLMYERIFPTGEHEIVRMIMTEKGLHRIAYVRRGKFPESEKKQWIERLQSGTIKKKEPPKKETDKKQEGKKEESSTSPAKK